MAYWLEIGRIFVSYQFFLRFFSALRGQEQQTVSSGTWCTTIHCLNILNEYAYGFTRTLKRVRNCVIQNRWNSACSKKEGMWFHPLNVRHKSSTGSGSGSGRKKWRLLYAANGCRQYSVVWLLCTLTNRTEYSACNMYNSLLCSSISIKVWAFGT